jgi:hypothetical protein
MGDADLLNQVSHLRSAGKSPKQIARTLGVSPSVVAPLVRAVAAHAHAAAGEPPVAGCWVNAGWSKGLTVDPSRGWVDRTPTADGISGLVSVLVTRRHRWDKVSVCGYLADVYCLGVKNAFGPAIKTDVEVSRFLPTYYTPYPDGWQEAPIELAADLVFGAVEYARGLGFEPHADFASAAGHLGTWSGPSAITFGKNGRPLYISGPFDTPYTIMKTLHRTTDGDRVSSDSGQTDIDG